MAVAQILTVMRFSYVLRLLTAWFELLEARDFISRVLAL